MATNRPDPPRLGPRRVLFASIVSLALAASAWLTRDAGQVHAVQADAPAVHDPLGDPAAPPARRHGPDADPSVPGSDSVFARTIGSGIEDTPPSF